MPIEIRELVVKATIKDKEPQPARNNSTQQDNRPADDATVQKIVDQVMKKIRNKNER